jgi:phosphoribosylamine--glycine ligase
MSSTTVKMHGISITTFEELTSFDSAIIYVGAHPERYFIKPSGEAQNIKRLLVVGQEDDGLDVIHVLKSYNRMTGELRDPH